MCVEVDEIESSPTFVTTKKPSRLEVVPNYTPLLASKKSLRDSSHDDISPVGSLDPTDPNYDPAPAMTTSPFKSPRISIPIKDISSPPAVISLSGRDSQRCIVNLDLDSDRSRSKRAAAAADDDLHELPSKRRKLDYEDDDEIQLYTHAPDVPFTAKRTGHTPVPLPIVRLIRLD